MCRSVLCMLVLALVPLSVSADPSLTSNSMSSDWPPRLAFCADTGSQEAAEAALETQPLASAFECTISVDCEGCSLQPVSCTGPTGECRSGGSGCGEWVSCGGRRIYCTPPPPPPPCPNPRPTCTWNRACTCDAQCGQGAAQGTCIYGKCNCDA